MKKIVSAIYIGISSASILFDLIPFSRRVAATYVPPPPPPLNRIGDAERRVILTHVDNRKPTKTVPLL